MKLTKEQCEHSPIQMCDPCCTCSRLEIVELKKTIKVADQAIQRLRTMYCDEHRDEKGFVHIKWLDKFERRCKE